MYNDYNYTTTTDISTVDAGILAGLMAFMAAYMLIVLAVLVFLLVCMWRIFVKAGKPGWAALIPIYNIIVLLEIVGRPAWWVIGFFLAPIPFIGWIASLAVSIIVMMDLAKSFGKEAAFGVLLALLPIVGYPMLAFDKSKYVGPSVKPTTTA